VTRDEQLERALLWLVVALGVAAYFYRLGGIPPGLFVDETSAGYNARCILKSGADEYGVRFPLFFRSLDDYKGPVLMYAVVLTTGLFGATPLGVRLAPALMALGFAATMFFLVRKVTGRPGLARWIAALTLFLPTTLVFGRQAVTEASSLGLVVSLTLLALFRWQAAARARFAFEAGALAGLCVYAYSTQRVLAPILIGVAAWSFYRCPRTRRTVWAFVLAGGLALLPYVAFQLSHPEALTRRFTRVSVLRDHPPLLLAAERIGAHYFQHLLSIDFLFRSGDPNPRHNLPSTGLLPVWMALPLVLGVVALWRRREQPACRVLLFLLPLAPVPVALTDDFLPHASRMLHLVPLALVAASLALAAGLERGRLTRGLAAVLLGFALLEGFQVLHKYFTDYAASSGASFAEGEDAALRAAFAARQTGELVFVPAELLAYDGTKVKFAVDGDCRASRLEGAASLGVQPLGSLKPYPPGSVVIMPDTFRPSEAEAWRPLTTVRQLSTNHPLWTVYRVE
jgi:4-amino-4-deoxy-L-arabinose transferase-like glycosyltransferase